MAKIKLGYDKDFVLIKEDKKRKNADGLIYQRGTWKNNMRSKIKFNNVFGFTYKFIKSVWNIYIFDTKDLIFDIFSRLGCAQCGKWRRSWMCPPYVPSVDKCKSIIQNKYDKCLMIIYRNDGRQNWKHELKKEYHFCRKYNRGLKGVGFGLQHSIDKEAYDMRDLLKKHGYKVKGFLSGKCSLCWKSCNIEKLDKNGKPLPCLHPDKVMPSPEAWGIDVYGMYEKLGIYYEHPIRTCITMANMIMFKEK